MLQEGRWLGLAAEASGVSAEPTIDGQTKLISFGGNTVELKAPTDPKMEVQYGMFLARVAGAISPWVDAQMVDGKLQLPEYPSENPKANEGKWVPGEYNDGVDNVEKNAEGMLIKEWGGQKMLPDNAGYLEVDPTKYPEHIERVMKVPHMPGQPVKEMWARLKAAEPRLFEDPDFVAVTRSLPDNWKSMVAHTKWAESCGTNSETAPAEWKGQEMACVPAVYPTPRDDTVSVCVGIAAAPGETATVPEAPGAEYDFLEYLYVKDQEGKVVFIQNFKSAGIEKITFVQQSFVPPQGTTVLIPHACFKIRGVWVGERMAWDETIENPDMNWFTNMSFAERQEFGDGEKLEQPAGEDRPRQKKTRKQMPKLWPENSWEGNAAKARALD